MFAVAWNAASPTIVASGSADDTVYLFQVCMPESYALDLFTSLLLRSLRPVPGAYAPQAGGTTEQRLEGHTDTVACLAFSSDGSMLASGGLDGDTPPVHALTFVIFPHCRPKCHIVSHDSACLTVTHERLNAGKVKIWDAGTGACRRTLEGPDEGIIWLQWHPRGSVLVAGSEDFTAWMWNTDSGQCMQVADGTTFLAEADTAMCALVSPRCTATADQATHRRKPAPPC